MTDTHDLDFQGGCFGFTIDGKTVGLFTAVSGLSMEIGVITFKQTNAKGQVNEIKRPGKSKYAEITLKRGLTTDTVLSDWFKETVDAVGIPPYKTAAVTIYTRDMKVGATFSFDKCWPSKLKVSDVSAGSEEVMIEEMTIQHELFTWEKA